MEILFPLGVIIFCIITAINTAKKKSAKAKPKHIDESVVDTFFGDGVEQSEVVRESSVPLTRESETTPLTVSSGEITREPTPIEAERGEVHPNAVVSSTIVASSYTPIEGTLGAHSHGGGTIEERDIPTETSMTGEYTRQGCAEHYNSRFIRETLAVNSAEEAARKRARQNLAMAVILGEVINEPAFKKIRRINRR